MATLLTIDTTPLAINPAYRSILFKVTSTDADIKAVRADLYVGGVYSTTINGTQVLGTTDEFNFDVSSIMQSILVSELRTNITSFAVTDAVTSAKTIKLRFFEIVETAGVHTTTWVADGAGTNYKESDDYDVVNMATQHLETLADWTVDDATKKLLTMRSNNNRIPRGVPFQVGFLTAETLRAKLISYDEDLNVVDTTTTSTTALTSSKGIIEIPASLFSDTDIVSFKLSIETAAPANRSIAYFYKVVDIPCKFTLFFQNHSGDFDHFDFGNKVSEKISTLNKTIKKPLADGYNSEDGGLVTVFSRTKTKVKVQTSALSATELTFLTELIKNHSVVYRWNSAGEFLKYVVKSHQTKTKDNDKLINAVSITLQPSNEHIGQKGD